MVPDPEPPPAAVATVVEVEPAALFETVVEVVAVVPPVEPDEAAVGEVVAVVEAAAVVELAGVVVVVAVVVVDDALVVGGGVGAPLTAVRRAVKYESDGNCAQAEDSAAHTSPALRDRARATAVATLASLVPWMICQIWFDASERPHSLPGQF